MTAAPTMTAGPWTVWKLTLVLYPFGAGAASINVYFFSLLTSWAGATVTSPVWSLFWGGVFGVPLTYVFAKHILKLIKEATQTNQTN
jgi:hypothetical protein